MGNWRSVSIHVLHMSDSYKFQIKSLIKLWINFAPSLCVALLAWEDVCEVRLLGKQKNHLNSARCLHDIWQESKGALQKQYHRRPWSMWKHQQRAFFFRRCVLLKEPWLKSLETGPRASNKDKKKKKGGGNKSRFQKLKWEQLSKQRQGAVIYCFVKRGGNIGLTQLMH